jgi:upstream activation factor subunit UAF30
MGEIIRIKAYLQTLTTLVSFEEDESKKHTIITMIGFVNNEITNLEQVISENLRLKEIEQQKKPSGKKSSSGFMKPIRISDELATLIGKEIGTLISRAEVSREIHKYIINNNLQDTSNRRTIIPDNKLRALLRMTMSDDLTYFNIQKYLRPHFIKG